MNAISKEVNQNREKLKQMTAEQLAQFNSEKQYGCGIPTDCQSANCKECIQIWLEQEARE